MQNLLQYRAGILEKGVYEVPYNGQTRVGMVDLRDVTEVAARIITDKRHFGSIHELATDECFTPIGNNGFVQPGIQRISNSTKCRARNGKRQW